MRKDLVGRLKGLLAMLMCLTIVAGCSVPVMAAGGTKYNAENVARGNTFQGGDMLCKGSGNFLVSFNHSNVGPTNDTTTYTPYAYGVTVKSGTWKCIDIDPNFDGDDILMIYLESVKPSAPETTSSSGGTACDHDYQWETEIEPTDTTDGVSLHKCTKCGDVDGRQPISCAGIYMQHCIDKIKNAKDGDTITISSDIWNSYTLEFMKALAARGNITIIFEITIDNVKYTTTITPDTVIDVDDTIPYYGPDQLIKRLNLKEVK